MPVLQQFQRDAAYDRLLALILNGRLPPDRPLSERKLAQALDIGRTPVREAIKALAGDGVLEIKPARGTYLRGIELEELQELCEARQMLEGQAAYFAAERGATPQLSAHREWLVKAFSREVGTGSREENATEQGIRAACGFDKTANGSRAGQGAAPGSEFHLDVLRAARNGILLDLYLPIRLRFRVAARRVHLSGGDCGGWAARDHLAILDAIEAREPEEARRRMGEHLARSRDVMRRLLTELRHRAMRDRPRGLNGEGQGHAGAGH